MTYQLSRVRLAGVGDRAARFTDLVLDVSSSGTSSASEPVDSILWLRNGGGKSSLLSLFFALLLPLRKDFMGKSVKRYLEDYVASGDTSHTVAEWSARTEDSLLPGRRLVTGAVYEWVDRRKPIDPDRDRDKLKGWYYSFFAVPGVLDLDRLPVHDETGRLRPMAEFVRLLRETAASRPQQLSFAITDQRGQWMETLAARNLDPALFRYQKQMNHSEGGVAELFNFPSTDRFIDFLIDLTVDSEQPELVASNLREVIDVLSRKPDLAVDRDFCAAMTGKLVTLAERYERAKDADRVAVATRRVAAVLAGAFRNAAVVKDSDKTWFAEEQERLRAKALKLDRERKGVNDTANELLRIAATHRRTAAITAQEEAAVRADQAKIEDLAWEAVGPLAVRAEVSDQTELVRQQMAEEERQSAPLRKERDDAAATLKARYVALATEENTAEEQATGAAEEAQANAEAEDERTRVNSELATTAKVNAENARGRVIVIQQAIDVAVAKGDLPDAEADPAVALARSRAAKRESEDQLKAVRLRRSARPEVRRSLDGWRREIATSQAARDAERDQAKKDRAALAARVDTLRANPRVGELLQVEEGGRLDLWADAADLRASLMHAVSTAESTIVNTRVDAADDDRALDGLRMDTFLPTTRDAQRAAEMIAAAGLAARPGWELLRDLVPESDRIAVLTNATVAELASGVVVTDADADKARAVLTTLSWNSVAHVAVSTARQLQKALTQAAPGWAVVPSDPALFDPVAAENARTERELRRHTQDATIAALHEQANADRSLHTAVETLLVDCPAGYLDALEKVVEGLTETIANLVTEDDTVRKEIDDLDAHDLDDAAAEERLGRELAVLSAKIERLSGLAEKVSELPGLHQAVTLYESDQRTYSGIADAAAARAIDYRAAERADRRRAAGHHANRERYERTDREILLLDIERDAVVSGLGDPLSLLQSRFAGLDARWETVAANSVLAERLTGLINRRKEVEKELAACSDIVRARAEALLGTGDGQDPERRVAARLRSREANDKSQRELNHAESEVVQAKDEVVERTPRDRPRHAQLDVEPATEAEARELAEIRAAQATEMSGRVTVLAREADEAERAALDAGTAAQVFGQRASRLSDAVTPVVVSDAVDAYAGDDEQAEADLRAALGDLTSAAATASSESEQVDTAAREVRGLASENRFSRIPDAIRQRFTGDDPGVLAERAAARANEMLVRRATIEGQLADIGRDQRLVVVEIASLVRDVLANLESAHRHSKLPGTLGGWGNEHFLRIKFVRPSSDVDLHARIDSVVDRIVAEKSKPEGLALLKRCVHEAVAPRGFTVKVLKPNSDLAVEPVDVTHLGKFSGGEKLTVCVALYCTLARLRAINRGRGRAALGGTLVLDNPLGTASHVALLRLQRDVAAAHGVQLVYTTGVEDLGAVGQFPNVLRMRNAPGSLRTRRYVVLEERFGSAVEGITSVRATHDDSPNGAAS